MTLEKTIRQIESGDPAIGIGTAAAASGILASRLVIKIAKKSKLEDLKKEAEKTKRVLAKLVREDIQAYKGFMQAYKSKDKPKIQEALKYATETPLRIAEQSYKIMELAAIALQDGKKSMALEAYGAILMGKAAVLSAVETAGLNLKDITDKDYNSKATLKKQDIHKKAQLKEIEMYSKVRLYL